MLNITPQEEENFNTFNLEDLVPDNLKSALEKDKEEPVKQEATQQVEVTPDPEIDPEDNPELNKILGLQDPEKTEEDNDDEPPFWAKFEEYNQFKEDLQNLGYSPEAVDKILEKAVETQAGFNNEVVTNLNRQLEAKQQELEANKLAVERSSKIESNLYFDKSEYAIENFHKPGTQLRKNMYEALKLEGAEDSFADVLKSENHAQMLAVLKDFDLDQGDLKKISEYWKQFRTLNNGYIAEKKKAEDDLGSALQTKIPEGVRVNTIREVINDFINQEEYSDLKEAINSKNQEYVDEIVGTARANMDSVLQALEDPGKAVVNKAWQQDLVGVFLDAAHKTAMYNNYTKLQNEHETTKREKELLKNEVLRLRGVSKGITKNGRSMFGGTQVALPNGKNTSEDTSVDLEISKRLLSGDTDIVDELIFGRKE